jgi:hypothetical protein
MNVETLVKKYKGKSYSDLVIGFNNEIDALAKVDDNHHLQNQLSSFMYFVETGEIPNLGIYELNPFLPLLRDLVYSDQAPHTLLRHFEQPPLKS